MNVLDAAVSAGTILCVDEAKPRMPYEPDPRIAEEMAESRLMMMRREKRMTVEQRIQLFECLSRDAAAIRGSAKRIR